MAELLHLLANGSALGGSVQCPAGPEKAVPLLEIWRRSEAAAHWVANRVGDRGRVGALLAPSHDCLVAMAGVWRAGADLVSLPHPGRVGPSNYGRHLRELCQLAGADLILAEQMYLPVLEGLSVPVVSFSECAAGAAAVKGRRAGGDLIQFTSGSTSRPKGIRLSPAAVSANVRAILAAASAQPGEVACSWVPLSHDMGLVGMLLAGWAGGLNLVLMRPESFIANPLSWLETCSRHGAQLTCSPNFGLELAARAVVPGRGLDLRAVRACFLGAEPIQARTLRRFAAATVEYGFQPSAFCPGYGLAEVCLAATLVRPADHWSSRWFDIHDEGAAGDQPAIRTELVSMGPAVSGMELSIAGGSSPGDIRVAGTSLLSEYLGAELKLQDQRWLETGDRGYLLDGELFVVGRVDDMMFVAGRNVFASEIERLAEEHPLLGPGCLAAVADERGRYVVVVERPRGRFDQATGRDVARWIRVQAGKKLNAAPSRVLFIAPGTLAVTPSGKLQRHRIRHWYQLGRLAVEQQVDFAWEQSA